MFRRDLILSAYMLIPLLIYCNQQDHLTMGKLIIILISDILLILLLILPEIIKPKGKLAIWLTKRILWK